MISSKRKVKVVLKTNQIMKAVLYMSLSISFCGCTSIHSRSTQNIAEKQENKSQRHDLSTQMNAPIPPGLSNSIFAQVWKRFVQDGRYRLANSSDFKIPEWAIKTAHLDSKYYEVPFQTTQIGHAAIVVDTTHEDRERFGLVIFVVDEGAKEGADQNDTTYWLYNNKDLSRTVISGSSGRLYVTDYEEDGTVKTCDIGWDDNEKKYVCKNIYTYRYEVK